MGGCEAEPSLCTDRLLADMHVGARGCEQVRMEQEKAETKRGKKKRSEKLRKRWVQAETWGEAEAGSEAGTE
eukprot:874225-Pleurochrysis_carterae.AAC.1